MTSRRCPKTGRGQVGRNETSDGMEEPRTERLRRLIERQYEDNPTGCGRSFGEIMCWEIHENDMTFN